MTPEDDGSALSSAELEDLRTLDDAEAHDALRRYIHAEGDGGDGD